MLNLHAGYQKVKGPNSSVGSYSDYKIGVTKEFLGFNFGVAWTYANTKPTAPDGQTTAYMNAFGTNIGGSRVAASVTRNF